MITERRRNLPRAMHVFLTTLLLVFALGQAGDAWQAHRIGAKEGYYFLQQAGAFLDFKIFEARFHWLHTADFWKAREGYYGSWGLFNYPAFAGVVAAMFYSLGEPWSLRSLLLFGALGVLAAAVVLWRACVARGLRTGAAGLYVGLAVVLSGPLYSLFRAANFEIVSWVLALAAVVALWRRRWMGAAILLGLATSFKLIPGTLLLVLVSEKRYRELLVGVTVAVASTALSLWFLGPTMHEAQAGLNAGMTMFRDLEVTRFHAWSAQFDHSLFAVVKRLVPGSGHNLHRELKEYEAAVAIVSLLLYWFRVRLLPRTNQIVLLTTCSVLLPPVSFEYTLVHVLLGWGVLTVMCAGAARASKAVPGATLAMVLFAVLNTDVFNATRFRGISFEGELKTVVLLLLMAVALCYEWPDAMLSQSQPPRDVRRTP